MKRTTTLLLIAFTALLLGTFSATAQTVSNNISYQGFITDPAGNALHPGTTPTNQELEFRIYDESQGGTLLWGEVQSVSVLNGTFSTLLGNGDTLENAPVAPVRMLPEVFNVIPSSSNFRYLEVKMGNRTFLPRQRLVAAAFAHRAKVAETVLANAITSEQIFPNSITAADIAQAADTGGITGSQIADNTIGQGQIGLNGVGANEMADNAVGSNEIINNSITVNDIGTGAVDTDELATDAVSVSKLADEVLRLMVPAGTVNAWLGDASTVPQGWLVCNGNVFSGNTYPDLFAVIGSKYNGRVPDLRGMFLRGADQGRGRDLDRSNAGFGSLVGHYQEDEFKKHNHAGPTWNLLLSKSLSSQDNVTPTGFDNGGRGFELDIKTSRAIMDAGGTETRPKNITVLYIIKAH